MGKAASKRKTQDPYYGQSRIPYTAPIYSENPLLLQPQLIAEIPFVVDRGRGMGIRETNLKAIAHVGLIFAFLQEPEDADTQLRLRLILDADSYQLLESFSYEVPERFSIYTDGDYIRLDNEFSGRDVNDLPGFSTEEIYGREDGKLYVMNPGSLLRLAV